MGEGIGEYRKWKNWYQNEVDEEKRKLIPETWRSITEGAISYFLESMTKVADQSMSSCGGDIQRSM